VSQSRADRGSWRGWHDDRYAYVELALIARCGGARILAVTRDEPARVLARFVRAEQLERALDAQGMYWLRMDARLMPSTDYIDVLEVACPRHGAHRLSIQRLVAEWQGVDRRRKSALVLDAARLMDPRPPGL
jgi:hypothetical protein